MKLDEAAAIQAGIVEFRGSIHVCRRGESRFCVKLVTHDNTLIWSRDVTIKAGQTLTLSPLAMALTKKAGAAV